MLVADNYENAKGMSRITVVMDNIAECVCFAD